MLTVEGVKALLKVKQQKLAYPESLVMDAYFKKTNSGICTCIAGQLILNKYGLDKLRETIEVSGNCHVLASSVLGMLVTKKEVREDRTLDTNELFYVSCNELFYVSCWSDSLKDSWDKAQKYSSERALVVAEVIDEFIAAHYKWPEELKRSGLT